MQLLGMILLALASCAGETTGSLDAAALETAAEPAPDGGAGDAPAADAPVKDAAAADLGTVSLSADVQPLFQQSCVGGFCHDAVAPAKGLQLTGASASYLDMVDVFANQCPSTKLVDPGSPDTSYLMWKLEGTGPCFVGRRMPRGGAAFTSAKMSIVRAWIAQGASDN
jgi:hypothetical protein